MKTKNSHHMGTHYASEMLALDIFWYQLISIFLEDWSLWLDMVFLGWLFLECDAGTERDTLTNWSSLTSSWLCTHSCAATRGLLEPSLPTACFSFPTSEAGWKARLVIFSSLGWALRSVVIQSQHSWICAKRSKYICSQVWFKNWGGIKGIIIETMCQFRTILNSKCLKCISKYKNPKGLHHLYRNIVSSGQIPLRYSNVHVLIKFLISYDNGILPWV